MEVTTGLSRSARAFSRMVALGMNGARSNSPPLYPKPCILEEGMLIVYQFAEFLWQVAFAQSFQIHNSVIEIRLLASVDDLSELNCATIDCSV